MVMGRPAPARITYEEYQKRLDAGARTDRELYPEFYEWLEKARKQNNFQAKTLIFGVVVLIVIAILFGISNLF